jgi:hypothetical protein
LDVKEVSANENSVNGKMVIDAETFSMYAIVIEDSCGEVEVD